MFTTKKIALVSVINDLVTDNRVNRACHTLIELDYEVRLVGRRLPGSPPIPDWPFKATRLRLLFTKGPAFYLFFNCRLFLFLLFKKADLLYANDLDTLLPNFLLSKLKGIPLIYDSHELFCDVPELQHSPFKRKVWERLEKWIVPKLKHSVTVNDSIAKVLEQKYRTKFTVVRNISEAPQNFVPKQRRELGIPENKKLILMQGAGINIDRGAEELIEAMEKVEGALLYIIGGGDVWSVLEMKVKSKNLHDKVKLLRRLPKRELFHYTFNADVGLSIDKDTNLNYHYSLPNKLFDYMQAGVPVLASRLPELEKIIATYQIGDFIENHEPDTIASCLTGMFDPVKQKTWRQNMKKACNDLNWTAEKQKLMEVVKEAALGAT